MTVRAGWDDWDPGRDLPALERLMVELIEEQRPVDARLVARAARALAVMSEREHAVTQRDAPVRLDAGAVLYYLPDPGYLVAAISGGATEAQGGRRAG